MRPKLSDENIAIGVDWASAAFEAGLYVMRKMLRLRYAEVEAVKIEAPIVDLMEELLRRCVGER